MTNNDKPLLQREVPWSYYVWVRWMRIYNKCNIQVYVTTGPKQATT